MQSTTNLVPRALLAFARWRYYFAAFGPAILIIPSFRAFPKFTGMIAYHRQIILFWKFHDYVTNARRQNKYEPRPARFTDMRQMA